MKLSCIQFLMCFIFYLLEWTLGVYYFPQRTGFTYLNEKYVYNGSAFITRFGRKSPYYYNFEAGIYNTWGNNITLHLVFYEIQLNQYKHYKRSFFEVQLKLCDLLERDPYFGKAMNLVLSKRGVTCPIAPATEVIPERAEVYYFNKKYVSNATAYIRRTSRKSPYYINVEGTTLVALGENVSLHGVFYEYLHNEYKRSFVELDMNFCDLIFKDPWKTMLGNALVARGYKCPAPPGTYRFKNFEITMAKFPYVMPFERVMLQAYAKFVATEEVLVRGRFYVTIKRDIPKGK